MSGAGGGPLELALTFGHGRLELDVDLRVGAGEVVAVVGPNGAGKSTLLHLVAGLLTPDAGVIRSGDRTLVDTARHIDLAPAERGVGVVFQDYRLFEHMPILDNVAFGRRSRPRRAAGNATDGTSRRARRRADRAAARSWLEQLGLAEVADHRPADLSGGQQQRVALARALASAPTCLLLDEPLAALDAETRADARRMLRTHLSRFAGPTVMVTHEPLEALALADRIVVLEDGRITQTGTPSDVARRPRSEWVAQLLGLNLFAGNRTGSTVTVQDGGRIRIPGSTTTTADADEAVTEAVLAAIHPRAVSLHRERPSGSPRNVWQGQLGPIEFAGDRVRVAVEGTPAIVAEVTAAAVADLDLASGGPVWVSFKASEVTVYAR